jgi:hypothetical protein
VSGLGNGRRVVLLTRSVTAPAQRPVTVRERGRRGTDVRTGDVSAPAARPVARYTRLGQPTLSDQLPPLSCNSQPLTLGAAFVISGDVAVTVASPQQLSHARYNTRDDLSCHG